MSAPFLSWQRRNAEHPHRVSWATEREPREECRQHYANVRIAEFQRRSVEINRPVSFEVLLMFFRQHGEMYDQGYRLRHTELDGAA